MTSPLNELKNYGQSVWYDNLNRELLRSGELQRLVDEDNVTGGTSNPSIFEKAVGGGDAYDEHIAELVQQQKSLDETFDALTVTDIQKCCDVFAAVYRDTNGADGYSSLEVSPEIANDTETTKRDAKRLYQALDRPNAMIKIPGTATGLPAIEESLADGVNINITLLFGVDNYVEVAKAYIRALERRADANLPVDNMASVASFFLSRVDTLVDNKLEEMMETAASDAERDRLSDLMGKTAIANAKIAYDKFKEIFSGDRWEALAAKGARVQRCLWASTSTKNPQYRDVLYVEDLIGPDTVNTLPQNTLDAFRDHGKVALTLEDGVDEAYAHIERLAEVGIDIDAVTEELQVQGVDLFIKSYRGAMNTVRDKRERMQKGEIGATARRE